MLPVSLQEEDRLPRYPGSQGAPPQCPPWISLFGALPLHERKRTIWTGGFREGLAWQASPAGQCARTPQTGARLPGASSDALGI